MPAPSSVVAGFNHNIRHGGRVFHVQTEDSGAEAGHVITHLFLGGTIVSSKKTSYGELRAAGELPVLVRALMEEQHKDMLRELVSGAFDGTVAATERASYQPGQLAVDGPAPAMQVGRTSAAPAASAAPARVAPAPPAGPSAGDDSFAGMSLDEVILRYLAGDDLPPK